MVSEQSLARSSERGRKRHQRETRWQIYLPFFLGFLFFGGLILALALQADPIWRIRIQALADWSAFLLCNLPVIFCVFPLYLMVILSVHGLNRLHANTERPLRKLENLASEGANRIEQMSNFLNNKALSFSTVFASLTRWMGDFAAPMPVSVEDASSSSEEGQASDESNET